MAATKIQAGYKGHKTRKDMKQKVNDGEKSDEGKPNADHSKKDDGADDAIDIDLDDPDVEVAATKIQAGYKGMKTRKEMKDKQSINASATDEASTVAEAGKANEEEEEVDIDLDDPDVAAAATKIQAGYRGMKVRGDLAESQREDKEAVLDPDDPEVQGAATAIQAGFKGMKARKEVQALREGREAGKAGDVDNAEEVDIDLDDPEVEQAATKIQAGYKGMRARKDVAARKAAKEEGEEESLTIISEVRRKPVVEEEFVEVKVADSGAIPFELHPSAQEGKDAEGEEEEDAKKEQEMTEQGEVLGSSLGGQGKLKGGQDASGSSLNSSMAKSGKTSDDGGHAGDPGAEQGGGLMIYHYRGSHNSQKVMMYLLERNIDFTAYHVDLQRNENLTTW